MYWVVQNDMYLENKRQEIIDTLEKFSIPHSVVYFSNTGKVPVINYDGPIITNGSIALSKVANERGWKPGSLFNENFNYEKWFPYYQNYLLNKDAVFTTIEEANPNFENVFVRPLSDEKTFSGFARSLEEFNEWKQKSIDGDINLDPATKILYSESKKIGQEHRHYIVDGEIITSSRYKLGNDVNYSNRVDDFVLDFVRNMIKIWQPAKAFVMDTYVNDDEVGIVEIGCICHAGLYDCNVQKLVMALDNMEGDINGT